MISQKQLVDINKSLVEKASINDNKLFILSWDKVWHLRKEGAKSFHSTFASIEEAEQAAKSLLQKGEVSSIIKTNSKGQLVDKTTYSSQGTFEITNLGYF